MNRGLILFIAVVGLTTSAASSWAHTFSQDPTHVGDITDPSGETDPRTLGHTNVPPDLDVVEAWIDALDPDSLVFHIQLNDLSQASERVLWRYYVFQFEAPGGPSACSGTYGLVAIIAPTGPGLVHPPYRLTCGGTARGPFPIMEVVDGAWAAGPDGNELQFVLSRTQEFKSFGTSIALSQGTAELSNLWVETWSWAPPPITDTGNNNQRWWYPQSLPGADSTQVLAGPIQV